MEGVEPGLADHVDVLADTSEEGSKWEMEASILRD
jgi:hypothetical protein